MQCAGAGVQRDALGSSAIGCEVLFEPGDFGAKNKLALSRTRAMAASISGLMLLVLCFQIEVRYFDVCHENANYSLIWRVSMPLPRRVVRRSSTGRPRCAMDCDAACRISTTRSPALPSGHRFLLIP